jgi:hypothetical protein
MKTYRESGPLIWCAAAATFEGRDQNSGLPRPKQRKKQIPPNETKLRERKWVWIFLFFSLFFFLFNFDCLKRRLEKLSAFLFFVYIFCLDSGIVGKKGHGAMEAKAVG